jgi:CheY-like chemotaxis protein
MPGMGGVEVARHIQETSPETQVVLATGYVEPAELEELLRTREFSVLRKPYTRNTLLRAVSDALMSATDATVSLPPRD